MNRKINFIIHESQKLDGVENILIENMDNVYPYSCDLLLCKYFNIFEEKDWSQALETLIEKIRPNGQLVIGVADLYEICSDYLNRQLSNKEFFDLIKNVHNHCGIDDLIEIFNSSKHILILETNNQTYINYITITKNK